MPGPHVPGLERWLLTERRGFAQHPVRAGGQAEPSRAERARLRGASPGHPDTAPTALAIGEGRGLATVRPSVPAGSQGTSVRQRVWSRVPAGAGGAGEPGPLRAAVRMPRAPEGGLASSCGSGRGLAMIHAMLEGWGGVHVQLGTGGAWPSPALPGCPRPACGSRGGMSSRGGASGSDAVVASGSVGVERWLSPGGPGFAPGGDPGSGTRSCCPARRGLPCPGLS